MKALVCGGWGESGCSTYPADSPDSWILCVLCMATTVCFSFREGLTVVVLLQRGLGKEL